MCPKVLAVLLTSHIFLIRPANHLPLTDSNDMNRSCTNSRAEPCAESSHRSSAADTVAGSEGNRGQGRSFMRHASKSLYPATRRHYRPSAVHRPSYSQQIRRYPLYKAQERFQPSEVGYRPKRPSSQLKPQPLSSPPSLKQDTGSTPSESMASVQPDNPQTTPPSDSYMPMPDSQPSGDSDTPPPGLYPDAGQVTSPKEPTMNQTPPSNDSPDDSYFPYLPKYPHYHESDVKPHLGESHDYVYVDHDPTLHEHKPDEHTHYGYSYYHAPPSNYTYQPPPPPANNSYLPMESMHGAEENRNKQPYTYYYIGRKLWYIPLYFSVYFIVYITSLLVKSIARHKIKFPANYWAGYARALGNQFNKRQLETITEQIIKALAIARHRYT